MLAGVRHCESSSFAVGILAPCAPAAPRVAALTGKVPGAVAALTGKVPGEVGCDAHGAVSRSYCVQGAT